MIVSVKGMKMLTIFVLICGINAYAQSNGGTFGFANAVGAHLTAYEAPELSIGDKVPDLEFSMVNYPSSTAKLSDFRGKLVILDFWATWCTSCINRFPKMDSLQKLFGDKLQVILVNTKSTRDSREKVEDFFAKWKKRYPDFRLPSAVMDTLADIFFKHQIIPHYVWIGPAGRVKAITSSDQVTVENISQVLADNRDVQLPAKRDISTDRPLYLSEDISMDDLRSYSFFMKGRMYGLPSGSRSRLTGNILRGRAMTNMSLLSLYRIAANQLSNERRFNEKQFVLEGVDSSKLVLDKTKVDEEAWYRENLYTYELIVPVDEAGKLHEYMLQDLNRYSGYYGRFEVRKKKCLVLVRYGKADLLRTKGGRPQYKLNDAQNRYLQNAPVAHLVRYIDRYNELGYQVIDETLYTHNIDIKLPAECKSLAELRKALQNYGLDLIEKEKEINVFVLSEKRSAQKKEISMGKVN